MLESIGCLHLLEGSEEYYIFQLLKITLEDALKESLETVNSYEFSITVQMNFRKKEYLMSGRYVVRSEYVRGVSISSFAYSGNNGVYEMYAPVNKYNGTKFNSIEELKAAMKAITKA